MGEKLQAAIAATAKKHETRIGNMRDIMDTVQSISTGNVAIDAITGVGGLPNGRIVELYGEPSSGKTTLALQTASVAMGLGRSVLYVDHENALDKSYCAALGIDVYSDLWYFCQPDSLEDGVNIARDAIKTGELGVVIFDSVAAMVPKAEMEAETGSDSPTFRKPKVMAQAFRQLSGEIRSTDTVAIFLNHIQDVIDTSQMGRRLSAAGVERKTTPGGNALKYFASLRLEFRKIGSKRDEVHNILTNTEEDQVIANKVTVKVTKNKVGPPFGNCEVLVRYGRGFSNEDAILNIAVAYGLIKEDRGGVFRLQDDTPIQRALRSAIDKDYVRGRENMIDLLEQYCDTTQALEAQVRALIFKKGMVDVPESQPVN